MEKLKQKSVNNRFWLLLLFVLTTTFSWSQEAEITGIIKSKDDGVSLPGASVIVRGTTKGVVSDFDGIYSIKASPNDILVFSFLGFKEKEVKVGNQKKINVALEEGGNELEEVVVIGYGTQRKSDLTGSVSKVKSESINQAPIARVDQALQGRAAGLQVTQVSGAPGAGTSIRLRGGTSINGSNEPLWVIDGIIVGTNFNLNNINSNDIKSIEVLKDASSIAIYGSRGANGVVLVTTKSGSKAEDGKTKINVNFANGIQAVPELPELLSQPEQIAFTNESAAFRGAALPFPDAASTYPNNDWYDLLLGPALVQNASISMSGNTGNVNYYNSFNYFNQEGIIKSSGIEKFIFRSNVDVNVSEKVKIGAKLNFSRINQDNGLASFGNAFANLPTQPVFNEDGSFNGFNDVTGSPFSNPLANIALNTNETFTNNLLATVFLEYKPSDKWVIRSTFNPNINNIKQNRFTSSQSPNFKSINVTDGGIARVRTVSSLAWNNENTIQYKTDIDDNNSITGLVGFSYQKDAAEIVNTDAFGITNDATKFNRLQNSDPTRTEISSNFEESSLESYFGRINYAYKNKYLLTLVGRYDGSSRFATGNQRQFFPSVAAAWKISDESFMENQDIVENLKLRASFGKTGNQAIPVFSTFSTLIEANTTENGVLQNGLVVGRPANPELLWETTDSFDVALEGSFFNGRIFTELNYYYKKTNGVHLNKELPGQTATRSILVNAGSLQNQGLEFTLDAKVIKNKNFNWNSTLTLSGNRNKILDLGGAEFIDVSVDEILGSGGTRLIVGESVPVFTGVRFLGTWNTQEEIDQARTDGFTGPAVLGGARFEDLNGDGIISAEDNVVLGSPLPDLIYGFENTFTYKDLSLSFYIQGTLGNEVYNLRTRNHYFNRGETTKFADLADRWTPENPTSNIPRAGADSRVDTPPNSEYVEDGSHLRLKNVRLAYNMPLEDLGIKYLDKATLYFSGSNLLLLSNFRLIDPETSSFGRSNITQGFANGEYPNPRTLTLGLNITF